MLREFLQRHEVTQLAASKALGVSDPTIHDWCKGTKRPRTHHRETIAVWTNGEVPVESWLRDDERAAMADVRPFVPRSTESTQDLSADDNANGVVDDPDESGSNGLISDDAAKTVASNDSSRKVG